jgi:secreted trypsin-like serine protease
MRPNKLLLQLGRSNSDNMLTHDIRKFILHPDFIANEDNIREPDIALVVMKRPVTFSDNIKSICVSPERSSIKSMVGKSGVLVGWKRSSIDLLSKAIPKMNQVPVASNKRCIHGYESDDKFCSAKMDSESSCDVAPGSGLIFKSKRSWKLRAIVSLGLYDPLTKECNKDSSFVFTDLGQHSDWIHGMTKKQNPLPLVSELTDDITLIDEDFPFF